MSRNGGEKMKYEVRGTTVVDVIMYVDADSEDEALEIAEDSSNYLDEYANGCVGISSSNDVELCATDRIDWKEVEEAD